MLNGRSQYVCGIQRIKRPLTQRSISWQSTFNAVFHPAAESIERTIWTIHYLQPTSRQVNVNPKSRSDWSVIDSWRLFPLFIRLKLEINSSEGVLIVKLRLINTVKRYSLLGCHLFWNYNVSKKNTGKISSSIRSTFRHLLFFEVRRKCHLWISMEIWVCKFLSKFLVLCSWT